jgi:GTPase
LIERPIDLSKRPETAVMVGVINQHQKESETREYLNELQFLLVTAGAKPLKTFVQKLDKPDSRTFIGSGKLEQIRQYVEEYKVDLVVFDDELSPSQLRNIEKVLKAKILDRSNLILDIFAANARTSYARTQVELAQYQYLLPRLTRMWTHLQKQKGGIGMKGPGETEIETDRRIVRDRIALLKEKLKQIDKQMATQRQNRGELIRVALVGYTNVGKSTIMNLLGKSDVLAENKLFATLDTTVRKVVVDNLPFLLSDTVGFIRKLPTQLVESFKSTLDEVREADILLHVVDVSHPSFEEHIRVVNETLSEIGASDKKTIMVFNKVDAFSEYAEDNNESSEVIPDDEVPFTRLERLKQTWISKISTPSVFISASQKDNIKEFKQLLYDSVKELHAIRYPYNNFLY